MIVFDTLQTSGSHKYIDTLRNDNLYLWRIFVIIASQDNNRLTTTFQDLQMYDRCLKDIELPKETGYQAQLMSKLDQRKDKCLKLSGEAARWQARWTIAKLSEHFAEFAYEWTRLEV